MNEIAEKLLALGYSKNSPEFLAIMDALVAISLYNLNDTQLKTVLDLLSSSGYMEVINTPLYSDEAWEDFNYGNIVVGDYVRVKPGSYDSELGSNHNGLVGTLINIKARRCTVRYIGRKGVSTMQHPIQNLQSLKHGVQ